MNRTRPNILIIGGVAAGTTAAAKAKRMNPHAKITLFEQGEFISYGACSMPYYIGKVVPDYRKLIHFSPEEFEKQKGCTVKIRHRVEEIRPHRKMITVRNLIDNTSVEYKYDRLLIATGAEAKILNPDWMHLENVFTLKSLNDGIAIREFIEHQSPKNALIVGGGFIGMEMAEAFRQHGMNVTVIDKESIPMPGLEDEPRHWILEELKKQSVSFIGGTMLADLKTENSRAKQAVTPGFTAQTDLILLALGFRPHSGLARDAHIRCGSSGGIIVDSYLKTSADHVFAAGACAEFKNKQTNKMMFHPLGNIANKMGRVAGINLTGGHETFDPVIRTSAVKIFNLEVAAVGMSSREAEESGYSVEVLSVTGLSRAKVYPDSSPLLITLISDRRSRRLLGANVAGEDGAALRANTLLTAIHNQMTIQQISRLDLIYTPPFAPVWDPILLAMNQGMKER